jgi:alpha,alpha-trehalose-phosphate synthase [UDP-forming]
MRILSLRLILALILGITLVSLGSSWYEVRTEQDALRNDLERKATTLGESLAGNAESYQQAGNQSGLEQLTQQFTNRDHLLGIGIYSADGSPLAVTRDLNTVLSPPPPLLRSALASDHMQSKFELLHFRPVYLLAAPLRGTDTSVAGAIVTVHDAGYIRVEALRIWGRAFLRMALQVLVIVVITLLIVQRSVAGPVKRVERWMKALRTGRHAVRPSDSDLDFLGPVAREVAPLAESLQRARASAETEARLRNANESLWTAERLADHVRSHLDGNNLFVVSNREPYIHSRSGNEIAVMVPASGVVTAIGPILCACNGTWVAHGSGDADAETVDADGRLQVPPDDPRYTLRRVWLSAEQEEGYYYGFSNEGLWPLCHNAHTRPMFRTSDWEHYRAVNEKFADALVEEIGEEEHPVVLIQDYHFALLPRMVKERLPQARIAIFWHIPWPNSEAFGICPWRRELLDGLLGADLLGFQVQADCNNFLDTVDHFLEARIDREHFSVKRDNHESRVRPFPISVEFPECGPASGKPVAEERSQLLAELGIEATFLGVGVDRVDYTKGIIERFQAVETFLEMHPRYQEKFTFIQIGAPTRSRIKRYSEFQAEVAAEAQRINSRFQRGKWRPIVFKNRQHNHQEVQRYYRVAHLCMVTSLHDGMNLVAKEFIAARQDERGVLILSQFTGAARELHDAILINPYDILATSEAIAQALDMSVEETIDRMRHMRRYVKDHNIYRWAADLVGELCDVRLESRNRELVLANGGQGKG